MFGERAEQVVDRRLAALLRRIVGDANFEAARELLDLHLVTAGRDVDVCPAAARSPSCRFLHVQRAVAVEIVGQRAS